ncbi:MAG: vanadium-dependent haloperoxidase [bacterium]
MTLRPRSASRLLILGAITALIGCGDAGATLGPSATEDDTLTFFDGLASTRWNDRAITLLDQRPPANGSAASSRILTYLSLAQYRAVLAAESPAQASAQPSIAAAVSRASATVLSSFFPLDAPTIAQDLAVDLAHQEWAGAKNQDVGAGDAVGKQIGDGVVGQAATDLYLTVSVGAPPVGAGYWVSNGTPIVRSLWGTTPFFLTSPNQFRAPPPPSFGSSQYLAALTQVRAISDGRTASQLAIAQYWNTGFTASQVNRIADELIVAHRRTEHEATRILAYANAATFDAQVACWDSKLAYWFIRPPQADPQIATAFAMPNHPSYPSAHSCITGAMLTVLIDAFPSERSNLESLITEAGISRVYAGIHYQFDVDAGRAIGASVAALALKSTLK